MASSLSSILIASYSPAVSDSDQHTPGKLGTTGLRRGGDTQRTLSASDAPHPPLRTTGEIHGD